MVETLKTASGLILDAHVHIGNWDDPILSHTWTTVPQLEQTLIEAGISGALVTTSDQCKNAHLVQELEDCGTLRYWFFPWVDPNKDLDQELAFLENNRRHISGLKLHPSLSRKRVTDPAYAPFLGYAQRNALPVLVHCGQWQEIASYQFVLDLSRQYPAVNFVMAHGGGNNARLRLEAPQEIERQGAPGNIYLDLTGLGLWWASELAIKRLGAQRFLFGSDFPLGHPKVLLGLIDALRIPSRDKDLILGQNLLRLVEG